MQESHGELRAHLLQQFGTSSPSDVSEAQVRDFGRRCATALRVLALRTDDAPADILERLTAPAAAFAALEAAAAEHTRTFAHLLLKDWTPSATQRAPFGDVTQRWSHMFTLALIAAVTPHVRNGNDDVLAVLRHVCSRALGASMPAPTGMRCACLSASVECFSSPRAVCLLLQPLCCPT